MVHVLAVRKVHVDALPPGLYTGWCCRNRVRVNIYDAEYELEMSHVSRFNGMMCGVLVKDTGEIEIQSHGHS